MSVPPSAPTFARPLLQLARLLPRSLHVGAALLAGLALLAGALEVFSLGLILPVLALLLDPTQASKPLASWLDAPLALLSGFGADRPLLLGLAALVAAFTLKTAYLGWVAALQARFAFTLETGLAGRLFRDILSSPWLDHLQQHSAQRIQSATVEVNQATASFLAAMTLMLDLVTLIALGGFLLWMAPAPAAIALLGLSLATWLFQRWSEQRLQHWGRQRQRHEKGRLQQAQQALDCRKEIELLDCADYFAQRFELASAGVARNGQRHRFAQQLPRLWIEWIAVVGMAAAVGLLSTQQRPMAQVFATAALFAAAAFRLMPTYARILGSLQTLRYAEAAVARLGAMLAPGSRKPPSAHAGPALLWRELRLLAVGFRYPDTTRDALAGIDLTLARCSWTGVSGGSGAGKSTLIDLILGLLTPTAGRILLDGDELASKNAAWRSQLGYASHAPALIDDSLRRNIALGVADAQIDAPRLNAAIRIAQLDSLVAALPQGVESSLGERGTRLSAGERQRVGIARALYRAPDLLILDEATSALDLDTEARLLRALREERPDRTVLIVSHRASTLQDCERVLRLEGGRRLDDLTAVDATPGAAGERSAVASARLAS